MSTFTRTVHVLIDRLAISPDIRERIVDATEIAYRDAREVVFESADGEAAAMVQRAL
jgi:excinuclease ABC subunit A